MLEQVSLKCNETKMGLQMLKIPTQLQFPYTRILKKWFIDLLKQKHGQWVKDATKQCYGLILIVEKKNMSMYRKW